MPRALVERLLADPLAWFELEWANLLAAVEMAAAAGLEEPAWELVGCLTSFFMLRSYWPSLDAAQERALAACQQAGNRRGEAALLCARGGHLTDAGHSTISLTKGKACSPCPAGTAAGPGHRESRHRGRCPHRPREGLPGPGKVPGGGHRPAGGAGLVEQLEARRDLAIVMWQLALLAGDTGRLLNDSLAIAGELDDWRGQAELLLELSKLRSDQGRLEEAETLLAAATDLWPPQVQGPGFRAQVLHELGRLRARQLVPLYVKLGQQAWSAAVRICSPGQGRPAGGRLRWLHV